MNRKAIEQLRDQYLTDSSVIFAMPAIVQEVPCGTAMCYAGQICANAGYELRMADLGPTVFRNGLPLVVDPWDIAVQALGLEDANENDPDDDESDHESGRLFYKYSWPRDLRDKPDTPALAAERLQRFLDSDGRE